MKIKSIKSIISKKETININKKFDGKIDDLNRIVILTGGNGAGKTRLLKYINEDFESLKRGNENLNYEYEINNSKESFKLNKKNIERIKIINYSHFDAKLQNAEKFSPYVIHRAKQKLKQCNYEETALNSLLFLQDLAMEYSNESDEDDYTFNKFINILKEYNIDMSRDNNKKIKFFGLSPNEANLSPGQLYSLRIAVGCSVHDNSQNYVFLIDEPETHLHTNILIKIVNKLLNRFPNSQFWFSTHSLELISYLTTIFNDVTTLYLENGEIKDILRSNLEPIMTSLLGTSEEQFAVKQLFFSPIEYACNKFCVECFNDPDIVTKISNNDPQVEEIKEEIKDKKTIILDYGAGSGRLLSCLIEDKDINMMNYNAFDLTDKYKILCENIMKNNNIVGKYYIKQEDLKNELKNKVDYVLLVNVLHEIHPDNWKEVFNNIFDLLDDNGKVVIVEREELNIGESPYNYGYLMLATNKNNNPKSAELLFNKNNFKFKRNLNNKSIICYIISKEGIIYAKEKKDYMDVINQLSNDSIEIISELKKDINLPNITKFKKGLKLSFWLNQFANANLLKINKGANK